MDIIITLIVVIAFLARPQDAIEGFVQGVKEAMNKK